MALYIYEPKNLFVCSPPQKKMAGTFTYLTGRIKPPEGGLLSIGHLVATF